MIRIETTQLSNGYYESQAFVRGKLISTCRALKKDYTVKEVEKDCAIVKKNLK
jgi:hypothetical protein